VISPDERRLAWAYLSHVAQGPNPALNALVDAVGPLEAARAIRERCLPEPLREAAMSRGREDLSERHLDAVTRLGGRLLTPDDAEWPAWRFLAFGTGAGFAAPVALWVLGDAGLNDICDQSVAVVGTRAPSAYGRYVASDIVGGITGAGWTVVSGGAFGIDAAAHRAALADAGLTVAVLACGVNVPYPAAHTQLLAEIADSGLVVSEYAPGVTAARQRFLERNRLIAALSEVTVVVEAGHRSGARNTAKWARQLGRRTLAVPGSIESATSVGCNAMIRDGEARLVTSAAEVLSEAAPLHLPLGGPADESPDERAVTAALPATGPGADVERIAVRSGVELARVRAILPVLELRGIARVKGARWARVKRGDAA
jgi:DNA processing protein